MVDGILLLLLEAVNLQDFISPSLFWVAVSLCGMSADIGSYCFSTILKLLCTNYLGIWLLPC